MKDNRQRMAEVDRLADLMARKALGRLTEEELRELEAWAEGSERRREYLRMVDDASFLDDEYRMRRNTDVETPLQNMKKRIEGNLEQTRSHSGVWLAVAASVAILLASSLVVWWMSYSKVEAPILSKEVQMAMKMSREAGRNAATTEPQPVAESGNLAEHQAATWVDEEAASLDEDALRVTTHKDKEFWLRLEDGTLVHLNYNTRIVYPEHFTGATRDVILEGEAYFMVAHDRRHPFIVHTPQGEVRQYGTEFNVNTRETDGTVSVVLVKGSIGVTPNNGCEIMMEPGQKLSVLNDQLSVEEVDTEPYVAWNEGYFVFRYQPLWKVTDVLAKWYDIDVRFATPELRNIIVVGNFDRYEKLENILSAIGKSTGTEIERQGRNITISK